VLPHEWNKLLSINIIHHMQTSEKELAHSQHWHVCFRWKVTYRTFSGALHQETGKSTMSITSRRCSCPARIL
jgi:hypothetical protein